MSLREEIFEVKVDTDGEAFLEDPFETVFKENNTDVPAKEKFIGDLLEKDLDQNWHSMNLLDCNLASQELIFLGVIIGTLLVFEELFCLTFVREFENIATTC